MKVKLYILALLQIIFTCAFAQNSKLYTTRQGVITSQFRAVNIDSRGMVWISGENMLGMFNGTNISYIPMPKYEADHQIFNVVYGIKEFKDNKYWVNTNNGLYLLNAELNTFSRIRLDEKEDSIYGYSVNRIADYPGDDRIIATTDGFGTFVIDTKTMTVDKETTKKLQSMIGDPFIRFFFIDDKKNLWYHSFSRKFNRLSLATMKQTPVKQTPEAHSILSSCNVNSMLETKNGKTYIATGKGILALDVQSNTIDEIKGNNRELNVMKIIETRKKNILLGTDSRGLWTLSTTGDNMVPYTDFHSDFDISFGKVHDMLEDNEGNIIAVLLQKGLLVIPFSSDTFRYHPISPSHDGKNASCITSLCTDQTGNYWIGTDGGGVYTTQGMKLASARPVNEGLRSWLVQSLIIDKHNTVWAASYGGGVQFRDNGRFVSPAWLESLSNEFVMSMYYDRNNDIIYIGTNGNGIYTIDPAHSVCKKFTTPDIVNQWISALFADKDGTLWIGTASGTYYYNPGKKKSGELRNSDTRIDNVAMFEEEGDRNLLVCTTTGLLIYDKTTGESVNIGRKEGLTNENIRAVTQTDSHIWLATANSIASIEKKTRKIANYTTFGGFYIGEFHRNAYLQPGLGNILFGGDNGIICFTPELILKRDNNVRPLLFTNLRIGGETVTYDYALGEDNILNASTSYASKIHLHHDNNSFSITFGIVELNDPERIRYDYILDGYEKEWHKGTVINEATYTSLPAGTYTLRVRAYSEDDERTIAENSIKVQVDPAWYASLPAKIIYTICVALILFLLIRTYRERVRQREILRQTEQKENMKEAKLRLFTSIVHELRSPLTMIISPLKQLQTSDEDEERKSLYDMMYRNCQRLLNIVKQITDIRKIDNGQFKLRFRETELTAYANEILASFVGMATIKRITFTIESSDTPINVWIDPVHFEKIITNILSNAFKFTPKDGKVIVRIKTDYEESTGKDVKGFAVCTFYNSGSHFNENDLNHLYERFYSGSASSEIIGSGIGLNLTYELVKLHHGTIEAHNVCANETEGVEFTVRIPLGNGHLSEKEKQNDDDEKTPMQAEKEMSRENVENLAGAIAARQQEDDAAAGASESGVSSRNTILIVDDDRDICEYLRKELENDYNIISAHSGNEAYKVVIVQRPDVIITDLRMPDGDGMELCKQIKENAETDNIPIIMLTAEGDEKSHLQSLNLQVDHFFQKPFNMLLLKEAITQTLKVRKNLRNKMRRTDIGYDYTEVTVESADDKLFARVNEAIKKHLDDSSFGVTQLSEEVGISRVHLNRKLKERYGVVPNVFIKSFRLKQAAYLLVNNKVNISEVAYKVGFSSHSYFTSSFREYFGMSPKEFIAYYSENINEEALDKLLE